MADANDIVCLGYGSWSSVNLLPTLGFGIGLPHVAVVSQYFTLYSADTGYFVLGGTSDSYFKLRGVSTQQYGLESA